MEEEMKPSSEVPVMKAIDGSNLDAVQVNNEHLLTIEQGQKDEEETTLDGEFVKVEKESLDVKDGSKPSIVERSLSGSSRELIQAQEKMRELEIELERVAEALKHSECENTRLKDEVSLTKEKLEVSGKKYEELELGNKKLQERIVESEEKYSLQLHSLQDTLEAQAAKHKELDEVKEAFGSLNLELESSRKRMQELENDLQHSAGEACKFEELHKQSGSHAESEMQRALEFERLLEVAKLNEKELDNQIASIQEEVKSLCEQIGENQKIEDALKTTSAELSTVQGELGLSKSLVLDMEQRLASKEAHINELTSELDVQKAAHFQVQEDISALEHIFASTKEDLHAKASEAKSMSAKLKILEEQIQIYEDQVAEASRRSTSLEEEMDKTDMKVVSLESTNEKLKAQILEAENKASQSFSENELFLETNIQLKSQISELQELLHSANSEKEATSQQLVSHMNSITELTVQHSRAFELQSATEARVAEAEIQLQDAIHGFNQRDSDAEDLHEKLTALEGQIKFYEEQALEATGLAGTRKTELEDTLLKLKYVESIVEELQTKLGHFEKESGGLAKANLRLTQEVAMYESKVSDLHAKLSAAIVEKDEIVEQLQYSRNNFEDVTQQLTSEAEKLKSQISSLVEENKMLNETCQNAKEELQQLAFQLEGQLKEQRANEDALKSEVENLKADIAEKSLLQTHLKSVEEQLVLAETQLKDQKQAETQKELEREEAMKHSLEETNAKKKEVINLRKLVTELEEKLLLANAKSLEKGGGDTRVELKDATDVKSRDIGLATSSPSKRKSRKKLEAASAQASSSLETHTQKTDVAPSLPLKFISGVALISVILGIVLGKIY